MYVYVCISLYCVFVVVYMCVCARAFVYISD